MTWKEGELGCVGLIQIARFRQDSGDLPPLEALLPLPVGSSLSFYITPGTQFIWEHCGRESEGGGSGVLRWTGKGRLCSQQAFIRAYSLPSLRQEPGHWGEQIRQLSALVGGADSLVGDTHIQCVI